jgi:hypothetical protein
MDHKDLEETRMDSFPEDIYTTPPFPQLAQLCDDLEFISKELVLRNKHFRQPRLPGKPQIELHDTANLISHCMSDVCTPDFDALITRRMSIRVYNEPQKSLSECGVICRSITITENPKLHCVWDDDRIFIKPIPLYLTSHAFWRFITVPRFEGNAQKDPVAAANGFLRSYSKLITHPSDFEIAKKHYLVPSYWTFDSLIIFLQHFSTLPDSAVSPRYRLGEMQLQTLNGSSFVHRGKLYYSVHRNRYNAYFNRFYGPTLFVFATFSVALSAMQVAIAVRQAEAPIEQQKDLPEAGFGGGLGGSWRHMGYAFRWFSIWSISFAVSMGTILFVMLLGLACMDAWESWKGRVNVKKAKELDMR